MKSPDSVPSLDTSLLNLGKDHERMTNDDATRQHATVDRLLDAFFCSPVNRREIQLLADEVGLGKTFVALGVAHTVLAAYRSSNPSPFLADMNNAYRAVVLVSLPP